MGNVCTGPKCLFPQVDDVEIAIPLDKVGEALKDVGEIVKATKACFPVFGIYLRFALKSPLEPLLAPNRNQDVAFIELHILRTRNGSPHLGFAAVDEIRQLLFKKYHGQAHFGKNYASDFSDARMNELLENQSTFSYLVSKYDPRLIFSNPFLKNLFSSTKDSTTLHNMTNQCAFNRTCSACSLDVHCFPGWKCVEGSFYKNARVCKKGPGIGCIRGDECSSSNCFLFKCR